MAAVQAWGRRHPHVADAAFGLALVAVFGVIVVTGGQGEAIRDAGPGDVLAVGTALVAVAGRRRWPAALLLLAVAVSSAFIVVTHHRHPILIVAGIVVAYTFATRSERRRAWQVAGGCTVGLFVIGGLLADGGWWAPENLGTFAWGAAAVAFGDATRSRRAYIVEVEDRARRAEETREEEARRRVAEERLRIARELHDIVAHHIAVINVHAGAATHVLPTQPEAAGPALAHIRRASDTVLKELASVVGVLRSSDDIDVDTEPTRGLARLSELLDGFAAAGLKVEHRRNGASRELPAVVDLAAYRIIQEALTNAQKHGSGVAQLTVTYTPAAVQIDVTNGITNPVTDPAARRRPRKGSGYGLVGMRERAAAANGTVSAGVQPGGRFVVHAELPAAKGVLL
ncbi:sensor histidine kinase [Virgisporangium aurantiacum]